MAFLENFGGDYELAMQTIAARRSAINTRVEELTPFDIAGRAELGEDDERRVKLDWVKVSDPRVHAETPVELQVRPLLLCGWVDDGSGFGSMEGIVALDILAKLPSGEEGLLGSMGIEADNDEPYLLLGDRPDNLSPVRWDSADAGLFLDIVEAALTGQNPDSRA